MQIPEQTINEIRERADIVEVISRFIDLRRSGSNFKGLCPFHEEKTPSFNANPDRQIFHCFGCGQGGNVFTFLMEMEGVSFPEAVRRLGREYGVEVPTDDRPDPHRSQNEMRYRVNDFAARWYHRNLVDTKTGRAARDYLKSRGVPEDAWETFQLGVALERWDGFAQTAHRKQIPVEVARELKLIVPRDKTTGYYDYFRKRLMFPILSPASRVVGFGGRTLDPAVDPKYLNSIESPVYAKRQILYGLPQGREAIRAERCAILVEGYMDCIALHVKGIRNVVASCGTAISHDHAALLRRLTRRVVLLPDADAAGVDAALVSGAVFIAAGLDVDIVALEEGTDPDMAVQNLGEAKFRKKMAAGMEYLQYLDYIMKGTAMTPRKKEAIVQRVTAGLGDERDRLRYEMITQDLARVLGVEPESLRRKTGRARRTAGRVQGEEVSSDRVQRRRWEKMLLRLLLETTPETAAARDRLDADDFSDESCREFYKLLDSAWENHIDIGSNKFQQDAEMAGLEAFAAEISLISPPPGIPGILLKDTVRRVKELQIRDELSVLREKLQELPEESEDAVAVAEHYARLKRALSEL
ncbi:MAG: DNA primase [Candidatus Krumholzibacteriia bacterium]